MTLSDLIRLIVALTTVGFGAGPAVARTPSAADSIYAAARASDDKDTRRRAVVRLDSLAGDPSGGTHAAILGARLLVLLDEARQAVPRLEAIVAADSGSAEGWSALALAYHALDRSGSARKAADTAIGLDPDLSEPYLTLGRLYREDENDAASLIYLKRYLDRNPDDQDAAYDFALQLLRNKKYDDVYEIARRLNQARGLPLLGSALLQRGDYEGAYTAYRDYIATLSKEERDFYEDISIVGLPREVRAYRSAPPETKVAFLDRFWMQHDPFKTSGGAMRRAEHYRRVWVARTEYARKKYPWDRRGEVYIKYGDPDWKSSSRNINARVPAAVQSIQEMMAMQIYGQDALDQTFVGPVYPIRSESDPGSGAAGTGALQEGLGLQRYKPVTAGGSSWTSVPWEVWIYTNVGDGLEVTFTDEYQSGNYDYAPVPMLSPEDMTRLDQEAGSPLRYISRMTEFAPASRLQRISNDQPERYDLASLEPLHFFYEALAFRGEKDATDLQVNIALPIDNVALPNDPDTTIIVKRRVVLLHEHSNRELRSIQDVAIGVNDLNRDQGLLAVERVNLDAPPGLYELRVQAQRRNTNLVQVYGQKLDVPNYGKADLALSDVQIAQFIEPADSTEVSAWTRGAWKIRPAPARTFRRAERLFAYYEIYNLARDEFGQGRYRVSYEVETRTAQGGLKIPMLGRLHGSKETIQFQYEQTSDSDTVRDYLELDISQASPARYVIRLTIHDLNAEASTSKEANFRIIE